MLSASSFSILTAMSVWPVKEHCGLNILTWTTTAFLLYEETTQERELYS